MSLFTNLPRTVLSLEVQPCLKCRHSAKASSGCFRCQACRSERRRAGSRQCVHSGCSITVATASAYCQRCLTLLCQPVVSVVFPPCWDCGHPISRPTAGTTHCTGCRWPRLQGHSPSERPAASARCTAISHSNRSSPSSGAPGVSVSVIPHSNRPLPSNNAPRASISALQSWEPLLSVLEGCRLSVHSLPLCFSRRSFSFQADDRHRASGNVVKKALCG